MGEKDLALKELEKHNDIFADIINFALFHGQEVVHKDELTERDPSSRYNADELREQFRDVTKAWHGPDGGATDFSIALFGFENQSTVDKTMAMRIMCYDAGAYRLELKEYADFKKEQRKKREQKEQEENNNQENGQAEEKSNPKAEVEFKFYPAVTVVIYIGDTPWTGNKNLCGALDIPEYLRPYVSDYKITVIDLPREVEGRVDEFRSDFWYIAKYIDERRKNPNFLPMGDRPMTHPADTILLLDALVGTNVYETIKDDLKNDVKGELNTVNKAFERLVENSKEEGRAEVEREAQEKVRTVEREAQEKVRTVEREAQEKVRAVEREAAAKGRAEGRAEVEEQARQQIEASTVSYLKALMSKLGYTAAEALDALGIAGSERGKFIAML